MRLGLRRQLPAYSPIRFASLLAGAAGALGLGRPRERLRARLTERYGTADLLLTDSGTTALRLAIRGALDVGLPSRASGTGGAGAGGRDAVALPAYCCPDVVTAAVGAGARVRLYDVDPATLGPDWPTLEAVLGAGDVGAVVAVHQYGIPVNVARIGRLAGAAGALVIDDAAQGFGGSIGGRPLGALGSLGVLSFGRGKGITGGGGGALLANDEAGGRALAAVRELPVRELPVRGRLGWPELVKLAAQWLLGRPSVYGLPAALPWLGLGETHYEEPWPPRGIARGPAAAVLANWEASLAEAETRRANAGVLADALANRFELPSSPVLHSTTGALRRPVLAHPGTAFTRASGFRTAGIERGYPYLPALPALDTCLPEGCIYVHASRLATYLWTLPTHSRSNPPGTVNASR